MFIYQRRKHDLDDKNLSIINGDRWGKLGIGWIIRFWFSDFFIWSNDNFIAGYLYRDRIGNYLGCYWLFLLPKNNGGRMIYPAQMAGSSWL